MGLLGSLAHWLDVRPDEGRSLVRATLGAFLLLAAVTLGRALRESLFLLNFPVENLPWITGAVALLSLPLVDRFTRAQGRRSPLALQRILVLAVIAGLCVFWFWAERGFWPRAGIVLFYLWTALGLLLLASGFWTIVAEVFAVRGAKRLFGIVSAGGTAGAMAMGASLGWLTGRLHAGLLVPLLIVVLLLLLLVLQGLPRRREARPADADAPRERAGIRASVGLIRHSPHLQSIALIVVAATVASTMLDYLFKEAARDAFAGAEDPSAALTGFLGAFYGWAGAAALIVQLLLTGRLISRGGIGAALAILPTVIILGAAGFALLPGLALATLARGSDYSLRKSLFRPVVEYLYVPLSADLRRRTKTFLDTTVDSLAEGLGAALILVVVVALGLPSRWLALLAILVAGALLLLSRRMDRHYLRTIVERLKEGEAEVAGMMLEGNVDENQLLSATFTRLDLGPLLETEELRPKRVGGEARREAQPQHESEIMSTAERLKSANPETVREALRDEDQWEGVRLESLLRLLARDALLDDAVRTLIEIGEPAVPRLAERLADDAADFVIRRRIPRVFARCGGAAADAALLAALAGNRFEIRYRSAIALSRRRKLGLPKAPGDARPQVWAAIRAEVTRERPVWELQKLLDREDQAENELVNERLGVRGELSLEHTFRLLSLVLEPEPVRAAFHGVILKDPNLKSFAQEYLEQVLPADVRERIWLFVGDVSEHQAKRAERPLGAVVGDLMSSRATLFAGDLDRAALRRILEGTDQEEDA